MKIRVGHEIQTSNCLALAVPTYVKLGYRPEKIQNHVKHGSFDLQVLAHFEIRLADPRLL